MNAKMFSQTLIIRLFEVQARRLIMIVETMRAYNLYILLLKRNTSMKWCSFAIFLAVLLYSSMVQAEPIDTAVGIKSVSGTIPAPGARFSLDLNPNFSVDLGIYSLIVAGSFEAGINYSFKSKESIWKPTLAYRYGLDYHFSGGELYHAVYFGLGYKRYFIELAPIYAHDPDRNQSFVSYSAVLGMRFH